jgi:hypothetical protein
MRDDERRLSHFANALLGQQPPPHNPFVFPKSFPIGRKQVNAPLVDSEDLKGHLRLLGAFRDLRETIEKGEDGRLPEAARDLQTAQRWTWFLHLAVERYDWFASIEPDGSDHVGRFHRWILTLKPVSDERFIPKFLPPLDVWMVLHTYLLNPQ